ncbi:MAG: DMT family transporter [Rhizobiaceae bacterium]|nr:DMT family transporter [Rhizobiaceae bacterium]
MSRTTANLLLLLAGAIWGMGFVAQQTAMDDIGPMLFIALRFLLAGFAVLPFAMGELKRANGPTYLEAVKAHRRGFFLVGLAFFLGMAFQQVGLIGTSVTNAGFLTALYVIMVPLLMITLFRVRQPIIIWPASLLSLVGIYLLSGGDLGSLNSGDMLIILCALFWAGHVILTGRVGQQTMLPVTMATTQFFITSALAFACYSLFVPFGFGETIPTQEQFVGALPEILYAGTIAGGLGFTLQAVGQRYTSESAAAVLISTESLFAAMFGAVFLGERLATIGYFGCGLIFIAILLVELMPRQEQKQPAE